MRNLGLSIPLALTLLATPAAIAQPFAEDEAALRRIKEELWPQAYFEQDTELLDRILAPEFQMVDGEGNWSDKEEEVDWVAANKPSYETFEFEILRLDVFANGTAIVAGEGRMRGEDETGAYRARYQSTNVLIKRDGVWRAVASHVSGYERLPLEETTQAP